MRSVVIARPAHVHGAERGRGVIAGRGARGRTLHALLEHGFDGAVVRGVDIERPGAGEFEPRGAGGARETQDTERGAVPLLDRKSVV